jgi:hypothetical protein
MVLTLGRTRNFFYQSTYLYMGILSRKETKAQISEHPALR